MYTCVLTRTLLVMCVHLWIYMEQWHMATSSLLVQTSRDHRCGLTVTYIPHSTHTHTHTFPWFHSVIAGMGSRKLKLGRRLERRGERAVQGGKDRGEGSKMSTVVGVAEKEIWIRKRTEKTEEQWGRWRQRQRLEGGQDELIITDSPDR